MYIGNNSVCLPQLGHPAASDASQEDLAVQSQQVADVEQNQNPGAKKNGKSGTAALMDEDDKR